MFIKPDESGQVVQVSRDAIVECKAFVSGDEPWRESGPREIGYGLRGFDSSYPTK